MLRIGNMYYSEPGTEQKYIQQLRNNQRQTLDFSLILMKFRVCDNSNPTRHTYKEIKNILAVLLETGNTLTELSLKGVLLTNDGFNFVLHLISVHKHLQRLDLTNTDLTDQQKADISTRLNRGNLSSRLKITGIPEIPAVNNNNNNASNNKKGLSALFPKSKTNSNQNAHPSPSSNRAKGLNYPSPDTNSNTNSNTKSNYPVINYPNLNEFIPNLNFYNGQNLNYPSPNNTPANNNLQLTGTPPRTALNDNHQQPVQPKNQPIKENPFSMPWPKAQNEVIDDTLIEDMLCSITLKIMLDPVSLCDGHTYEREAITEYLKNPKNDKSPNTNKPLANKDIIEGFKIRQFIQNFLKKNPVYWQEVYLSESLTTELLQLSSKLPVNLARWMEIIEKEPRLLTAELTQGQQITTLFAFLCNQNQQIVQKLIPAFIECLTPADWKKFMAGESVADKLKLLIPACSKLPLTLDLIFASLQSGLGISITPDDILSYAHEERNENLLKFGLSQLSDINEPRDSNGNTLLHLATQRGDLWLIHHLLAYGANLSLRNKQQLKPKHLAPEGSFIETVNFISHEKKAFILRGQSFFNNAISSQAKAIEKRQLEAVKRFERDNPQNANQGSVFIFK